MSESTEKLAVVTPPTLGVRDHVVAAIEDMLVRARAGQVRACIVVEYRTDGSVMSECAAESNGELLNLSAGVARAQYSIQQRLDDLAATCDCGGAD